jgi:protein phosphatase
MDGMGTTLVALIEDGDVIHLANVGDSRAYLLRQGELSQVTVDHSLVQELVDEGRLRPEDAERHPQRSIITRALGINPEVEFDLFTYKLRPGDRLLLCSDGLSDVVEPAEIRNVLLRVRDGQKAAERLVEVANEHGGPDNITVIVVEPDEGPREDPNPTGELGGALAIAPEPAGDLAGAGRSRAARAAEHRATRSHRRVQRILVALIVLVVIAAVLVAGRQFLFSRYWVGFDGDSVAVFRGVPGDVAGLRLSELVEHSLVTRAQVPPGYAARLDDGVSADSLAAARRIANCAPVVFSPGPCSGAVPATTTTVAATTTTRAKKG